MISFRYHIVSIVGIFLALAVGIAVGTTALNGPITTDLRKQVNTLKSDRSTLATQVKSLQGQVNDANSFANAYGAELVAGQLSKQRVLVIGMPGSGSSEEDQIISLLNDAGATVTGRLDLTSAYTDQRRSSDIVTLATSQRIGITLPETNDAGKLAGALLSYVLVGKGDPTALDQVLGAFSQLQMLNQRASINPATNIVVVGTGTLPANSYPSTVEQDFVAALQQAGGNVVVGGDAQAANAGGLVADVRGPALRAKVSSVDDVDTAIGQVSTVLALKDISSSQKLGHYGTGPGAQSLFPPPSQ